MYVYMCMVVVIFYSFTSNAVISFPFIYIANNVKVETKIFISPPKALNIR